MTGDGRTLTIRALLVGLGVGLLMCCSNMYFGLQSGWGTMGSLQSAILGFGAFKAFQSCGLGRGFSVTENVIIQTTSVATATMPFTAGFVSIIPALGMLTSTDNPSGAVVLSTSELILWGLALAFFGVFAAIPLRAQTILREKLRFPSGAATAKVIDLLHQKSPEQKQLLEETDGDLSSAGEREGTDGHDRVDSAETPSLLKQKNDSPDAELTTAEMEEGLGVTGNWWQSCKALLWAFAGSFVYKILAELVRVSTDGGKSGKHIFREFPIFSWMHLSVLTDWGWTIAPQLGYVGQGMIMGPRTCVSMLAGAFAGFALLGPIAKSNGWAPGEIGSYTDGATGWVLWISLAVMLGDSLTSLLFLTIDSVLRKWKEFTGVALAGSDLEPKENGIPALWWIGGLGASTALCTGIVSWLFSMPVYQPIIAVALAGLVAVLAVRALGETDLNPVSGVGKLSQLVFAVVTPGKVVPNIVAGAIAEAGATQAGDMMQDFKTAHLLGVPPRPQFIAQLVGSLASVFFSVGAYALFSAAWEIPGDEFKVPTAEIWIDMARLFNGGSLPPKVLPFVAVGAVLAAGTVVAAQIDSRVYSGRFVNRIPSGIGFAVGMYVGPKYTLPRVFGSLAEQLWLFYSPETHSVLMIVVASGLVLGEGTAAIVVATIKAIIGSA
ncbi:hypothetical protein BSKO_07893 [Bryopsis sp. KO-2023]|nr:hypothetical protein BSKO_07893 [Bryopsis sp. KO-2023]